MAASRLGLARQASRSQLKARVAIDGPTGSGKTWTALEWATALAGPDGRILVLDTEHGSAEWYSDSFRYEVITWAPPYDPHELAATISEAQHAYDVIVTDSFSHFWEGEGGTRDIVDAAAERSRGNTFAGWKVGTPALRHLIDSILAADAHVICTMRSKMEYVLETNAQGKQVPKKVGLAPVMRQGVEYEFTLIADMDLEHRMLVTKSRCPALADQVFQPHRAADGARLFLDWLNSGEEPVGEADAQRLAEAINAGGKGARQAWLDRFSVRPTQLPASRLAEANEFIADLAAPAAEPEADIVKATLDEMVDEVAARHAGGRPDDDDPPPEPPTGGPPGDDQGSGGSTDREAAEPNSAAPDDGVAQGEYDTPPEPASTPAGRQAVSVRQVAQKAGLVFKADGEAAPRGKKTRVVERLRHALTFAVSGGRAVSLNDLTAEELGRVWQRLDDIEHGRLTYTANPLDDAAGVTFTSPSGRETTVLWADSEMAAGSDESEAA